MKYLVSQLTYFLGEPEARKNLRAFVHYLVFLLIVIAIFAVVFHLIMVHEDQQHSWLTGFYWTLTVMTTLGFGDITFHSDLGRMFSVLVLLSGVVLLLIVLPFMFIRYFYAPWLEAQLRQRVPKTVPAGTQGHVIICRYESICRGLIRTLRLQGTPYFVIEPDPVAAVRLMSDGISVVNGEVDGRETYENLRVDDARLVFANAEDTINSSIAFTIRETSARVPILALAEDEQAIDILELSGATEVLPLKHRLGEQLANVVKTGARTVQVIGRFQVLRIGEFLAHDTFLVGKTLRETELRRQTGVNVIGVRERGKLQPVTADTVFSENCLAVVIGTAGQLEQLNAILGNRDKHDRPVIVIGGGKVGLAAANALKRRGVTVRVVDKEERVRSQFEQAGHRLIVGDAADREVLRQAGLDEAKAVLLTTNEDAMNIYLAVYCRRLQPDLNIVSRITLERNIDAIYRAGADSVLSYASLGREHVRAFIHGRDPVLVGEGADLFSVTVPNSLVGKTLDESDIGSRTGLIVVAVESDDTTTNAAPTLTLKATDRLLMLGSAEQRTAFGKAFG